MSDKPTTGTLTCDVIVQSIGFSRRKGQGVSSAEVSPALWEAWLEEGIVAVMPPPDLPSNRSTNAVRRRKAKEKKVL